MNYVDPETGKMWIYPDLVEQSGGESKKRGVSETTPESVAKKMKSDDELEKDGETSRMTVAVVQCQFQFQFQVVGVGEGAGGEGRRRELFFREWLLVEGRRQSN